jgi:transposase
VAEGGGLLNRYRALKPYRGFESLPLRQQQAVSIRHSTVFIDALAIGTNSGTNTKPAGAKRRRWPDALKRELVAAAMAPGASVSVIARRHDLNTNQLFKWCRQFGSSTASAEPAGFLPVEVMPLPAVPPPATGTAGPAEPTLLDAAAPGSIEVVLAGGIRVKIIGAADAKTVSAVLRMLLAKRRR